MADKRQEDGLARNFRLPSVDKLLRHPEIQAREKEMRRDCLAVIVRQVLDQCRKEANQSANSEASEVKDTGDLDEDAIVKQVLEQSDILSLGSLRRVINGTGVILNTNLGRAPLPKSLVERVAALLPGYSSLEIDLETGSRGERSAAVERLLVVLTGCEAAIVVNNNAAAVLLLVNALASGKEVIVSRGELIEIGGSFRLPDVIEAGGAVLKEVGTTNRTRLADYEKAINDKTALMLKCHRSNFEISGFTEEASLEELKQLSDKRQIPLVEDLGSGALLDLSQLQLAHEPTVSETVKFADVVLFSGDKLLGGSQAGLIVGKREFVKRLRSHPTYRALRLDKLNVALLEQILAEYLRPDAMQRLPIYQMASLSLSTLEARANACVERLASRLRVLTCEVTKTESAFGGGTLPGVTLASYGLKIGTAAGAKSGLPGHKLAAALRKSAAAIMSLTSRDSVIIDLRTVDPGEESEIDSALMLLDEACSA